MDKGRDREEGAYKMYLEVNREYLEVNMDRQMNGFKGSHKEEGNQGHDSRVREVIQHTVDNQAHSSSK